MPTHTYPSSATHELDTVVRRAGGVLARRDGRSVTVNFGSSAGELAACVTAVGVSDRSDLVKLELTGPQRTLTQVVESVAGAAPAPGGALPAGATWWCAAGPERVLVLSDAADGEPLRDRIGRHGLRHPALAIRDRSDDWVAIAIVGARAGDVLSALGVYGDTGDPRAVAPVSIHVVAGSAVLWLLQSDHRALALMGHAEAPAVWAAVHRAGRGLGICAVGRDALTRYSLLARLRPGF